MDTIVRPNERLADAARIPCGLTVLVGGGGKTTLMLRIARELAAGGARVIVTTTTHIFPPEDMPVLLAPTAEAVGTALANANGKPVCVGEPEQATGKLTACPVSMETLVSMADYVIAEADGAKGKPLKAPAEHEPVIPGCASLVIAVAGMDGVGQTVEDSAFRAERYAALIGKSVGDTVAPDDAAAVLTDPAGQRKHVPQGTRFLVALNKAGAPARMAAAKAVAERLRARGAACLIVE